jgi:hypothetical protein
MTDEHPCLESAALPIIITVPLLVECQRENNASAIFIVPFTREDMAVTRL